MSLFGRRPPPPSAADALRGASWRCANCGRDHVGMFDLAAAAPDYWKGARDYEPNGALRTEGNFLSEDFCVLDGEHFFVRCVFEIPVHDLPGRFAFGVWSTLSRRNFDNYLAGFDDNAYPDPGPWSSWFSTRLATFPDTAGQLCWMTPRGGRQRPVLALDDDGHPLALAQREGITAERVLEIYAAYGHAPQAPPAA
ncbi:MAG TPA: DUF2199 domain-containing protein [Allosphingosinicella sp.]|jgi:hypothetical protein